MGFKLKNLSVKTLLLATLLSLTACIELLGPTPSSPPLPRDSKPIARKAALVNANCLEICPTGASDDNIVVDHKAILLSSNRKTKFADWVAYKASRENIAGPDRKRNWAKDPKIDSQLTFIPKDYAGMGKEPYLFDHGHQAPLASFKNHPQWFVVNYLSNITPQKRDLNQGPWRNLEAAERKLALRNAEAYVLTGPYYSKNDRVQGPPITRIAYVIPSGYWKIIALKKGKAIKTVSFILPQSAPFRESYCKYRASLSKIEHSTGLKFFKNKTVVREQALSQEIGCTEVQTQFPFSGKGR